MSNSSILKEKRSLVFGAGGSIGAAIAREFAAQGADVFLSGRRVSRVQVVATEIVAAGGRAHVAELDALDDPAVTAYVDRVVREAGRIDVVFNAIGPLAADYGGGKPAVDLTVAEFMVPLTTVVRSQFLTAMAAARHMKRQRSGVIMFLTGSPA